LGKRSGIGSKKEVTTIDPMDLMDSLFSALDLFDSSNDTLITSTKETVDDEQQALIYRDHKPNKRELLAVKSNQYLAEVLKGLPEPNTTWHAISNSRFDFWSFIPAVISYLNNYTTELYISTWTTNNRNTQSLIELYDQGKIGKVVFVVGRYFQSREQATYNYLASNLMQRHQKLIVGEHHAKIMLLHNQDNYIVIESSANLTSNPRTENFVYSNDKDLYYFYKSWFEGLTQGKVA
jgi:hypothetical protein